MTLVWNDECIIVPRYESLKKNGSDSLYPLLLNCIQSCALLSAHYLSVFVFVSVYLVVRLQVCFGSEQVR